MEERPPYLIEPGDSPLHVTTDGDGSIVDVAVSGPWTELLRTAAARTLRHCLAERPAGIVVDLTGIEDPQAASVATWVAAARTAAETLPAVGLAICPPAGSALATEVRDAAADLRRDAGRAGEFLVLDPSRADRGPVAGSRDPAEPGAHADGRLHGPQPRRGRVPRMGPAAAAAPRAGGHVRAGRERRRACAYGHGHLGVPARDLAASRGPRPRAAASPHHRPGAGTAGTATRRARARAAGRARRLHGLGRDAGDRRQDGVGYGA